MSVIENPELDLFACQSCVNQEQCGTGQLFKELEQEGAEAAVAVLDKMTGPIIDQVISGRNGQEFTTTVGQLVALTTKFTEARSSLGTALVASLQVDEELFSGPNPSYEEIADDLAATSFQKFATDNGVPLSERLEEAANDAEAFLADGQCPALRGTQTPTD